jgi:prepilin-type N-terminal cleavage/methylation domain-containing protein
MRHNKVRIRQVAGMAKRDVHESLGFTLIELMIVVAIIGILAAIAVPNFMRYQAKSKQAEVKLNMGAIGDVAEAWKAEKETYQITAVTDISWAPQRNTRYDYWYDGLMLAGHTLGAGGGGDNSAPSTVNSFLAGATGDVGKGVAGSDQWTYNQNRNFQNTASGL